jgi:hypothetical protein
MKAGKFIGIIILVIGIVVTLLFYFVASNWDSVPQILIMGPALIIVGVAMIIFPGGDFSKENLKNNPAGVKEMWKKAPFLHKTMWIVATIVGTIACIYLMIESGFM